MDFIIEYWLPIGLGIAVTLIITRVFFGCYLNWHAWNLVSERDRDGMRIQDFTCKKCNASNTKYSW